MQPAELKDQKITILGSARSGMGAARLMASAGAQVLVSDVDPDQFTAEKRQAFEEMQATFEFGYHSPDVLESDIVVVSPGVPDDSEIMQKLAAVDIPVFSEVEATSWFIHAPIIAVTGSNGKTTTVNLIHHLLQTAGLNSFLGGNVGQAISEVFLESQTTNGQEKIFVLEISSFQLDHIDSFAPHVAVLLNLSPDHLDRYPDVDAYYRSKMRIFENQSFDDLAIINADDDRIDTRRLGGGKIQRFSTQHNADYSVEDGQIMVQDAVLLAANELPIPGPHNLSNALAAIAAVGPFITDNGALTEGLCSFRPVPHRLEYLGEVKGIKFYNDSKATNVASTEVALRSFEAPVWPILGGKDKGGDFSELIPLLKRHAREILLVGAASQVIKEQLGSAFVTHELETIDNAVSFALKNASSGDVLLLSPACASFDQFDNFEARGDHFRAIYQRMRGEG